MTSQDENPRAVRVRTTDPIMIQPVYAFVVDASLTRREFSFPAKASTVGHNLQKEATPLQGPYDNLPSMYPQNSSTTSLPAPLLTARYLRPSTAGSQFPGLPSAMMPPASLTMSQPAHTSHALDKTRQSLAPL